MLNCMCLVVGVCITHPLHYTHLPGATLFLASSLPPVCCQPHSVKNKLLQDTWSQMTASFRTNSGKRYQQPWAHRHLRLASVTITDREERACRPSHPANLALLDIDDSVLSGFEFAMHKKCSTKLSYNSPACTICSHLAFTDLLSSHHL